MLRSIFAVSFLAFFLPLPFVECQLQAAWKLRQEGNTDNQAFISMNGNTANLPPFLGQMLGSNNSLGDFLSLFSGRGLHMGAGSIPKPSSMSSILTRIAPQAANNSGRTSLHPLSPPPSSRRSLEEVEIGSGHSDNDTWIPEPHIRDDRPVPGEVDVGPDGLLYFKGNQSLNLVACRTYCNGYRGFRLAIAKANSTMRALRSYGSVMIDLTIVRNRKTNTPKFVWGDGTELDRSLLGRTEPVVDGGQSGTVLVMYSATPYLNDADSAYKLPCLCQGSFGTTMEYVL